MPKISSSTDYDEYWDDSSLGGNLGSMLAGIARGDYDLPHIAMSERLAAPTERDREKENANRVRQLNRPTAQSFRPPPPRRVQGR